MDQFRSFNLKLSCSPEGLWAAELVDSGGHSLSGCPIFYSRYSMWAQAHALTWYADELYKIKKTTTPLD